MEENDRHDRGSLLEKWPSRRNVHRSNNNNRQTFPPPAHTQQSSKFVIDTGNHNILEEEDDIDGPSTWSERCVDDFNNNAAAAAAGNNTGDNAWITEEDMLEEKWILKLRVVSVVDLPTSLLPSPHYDQHARTVDHQHQHHHHNNSGGVDASSPPLCPLFKIGLVTVEPEEDDDDGNDSDGGNSVAASVMSKRSRRLQPQRSNTDTLSRRISRDRQRPPSRFMQNIASIADSFQEGYHAAQQSTESIMEGEPLESSTNGNSNATSMKSTISSFTAGIKTAVAHSIVNHDTANGQDLANIAAFGGIAHIPNIQGIRCTVGHKIVSKVENGSAEWHEEIVWSGVSLLRTKMVVELCSRTPPHIYRGGGYQEAMLLRGGFPARNNADVVDADDGNSSVISASPTKKSSRRSSRRRSSFTGFSRRKSTGSVQEEGKNDRSSTMATDATTDGSAANGGALLSGWGRKLMGSRATAQDTKKQQIEEANSAAAVAKYLMEKKSVDGDTPPGNQMLQPTYEDSIDYDLLDMATSATKRDHKNSSRKSQINGAEEKTKVKDLRLAHNTISLANLALDWSSGRGKIERWFKLEKCVVEGTDSEGRPHAVARDPSVLFEISIATKDDAEQTTKEESETQQFHASEDPSTLESAELSALTIKDDIVDSVPSSVAPPSHEKLTRLGSSKFGGREEIDSVTEKHSNVQPEGLDPCKVPEDLMVPGVVDFVAIVGPTVAGNLLREDDGANGWVRSSTQPTILEQFPKSDDFHWESNRRVALPNMLEWFCFPEGVKIWRGVRPPTHADLKSHFSFSNDASIASFDACFNCATSFGWFLVSSTGESYGSKNVKTYAAVVRFYAPAPYGIDETQDDFGQNVGHYDPSGKRSRLWIPVGICLTSNLPIVGTLEAMLLRLCEGLNSESSEWVSTKIHTELISLIINAPSPLSSVVHCSVPFLSGERFHLTLPPPRGLPPLPHGACITSACKLLGSDGLITILAAVLTESKVLLHSNDSSNLAMVGEVVNALIYPFAWALPYVPVLPREMLEFVEAPLSYIIGVPTCMMSSINADQLVDVVVIDLDANARRRSLGIGVDTGGWGECGAKRPLPLPQDMSQNITYAVNHLLREEEKVEAEYGKISTRHLPRLDHESLAEREFRVRVALEVCGLFRGYQECLFFVASYQPVFNRDRFLRISPAVKQDENSGAHGHRDARAKRFMSVLLNTQHFHQFLERLEHEDVAFFHEIMDLYEMEHDNVQEYFDPVSELTSSLQKMEDVIPTYRCNLTDKGKRSGGWMMRSESFSSLPTIMSQSKVDGETGSFAHNLLQPISSATSSNPGTSSVGDSVVKMISLEMFEKISQTPWVYSKVFDGENNVEKSTLLRPPVSLRAALGDEKYEEYEIRKANALADAQAHEAGESLDLGSLVSSVGDTADSADGEIQRDQNRSDLECIQLCLKKAYEGENKKSGADKPSRRTRRTSMYHVIDFKDTKGGDLVSRAEVALRNPSARKYLISILSHRTRFENQRKRHIRDNKDGVSSKRQMSSSRLARAAFDCLVRLCHAMLEACQEVQDFETAYQLLANTAGFYMVTNSRDANGTVSSKEYMTGRIGMHPIFSNIRLWEQVYLIRQNEDKEAKGESTPENSDYETAVSVLYEMGSYGVGYDELRRFVKRVSKYHGWTKSNTDYRNLQFLAGKIARRRKDEGKEKASDHASEDNGTSMQSIDGAIDDVPVNTTSQWETLTWSHPIAEKDSSMKSARDTSPNTKKGRSSASSDMVIDPSGHYGRCMISAHASFGSSVVVTGAVDGSLFLAHTLDFGSTNGGQQRVTGARLSLGNDSGAVSCLATIRSGAYKETRVSDENEYANALHGCYIVAGTTGGVLKYWSLKDVYQTCMVNNDVPPSVTTPSSSLNGTILPKHRGGVTCIDTPSPVYRPDSIISGGGDGVIKILSLDRNAAIFQESSPASFFGRRRSIDNGASFEKATLTGHGGQICCLKSSWDGDKLLSGGADEILRLWDIGSNGGKCVRKMVGHSGWVTHAQFWGDNTMISASTDRTVAIWDDRSGHTKVTQLFHHHGPVSDLLVGSRSEAFVVSASGDGTVATWDLRVLTNSTNAKGKNASKPVLTMEHCLSSYTGRTALARGTGMHEKSVISTSVDGMLKEWAVASGELLEDQHCGHSDQVSFLSTFTRYDDLFRSSKSPSLSTTGVRGGTITSAWDGTVRVRRLVEK